METHDRDQVDDLLDAALKRYGEIEPRAGLEGRVLARLAQENHTNWRRAWAWPSAAAFACLLAVVAWIGIVGRRERPNIDRQAAKIVKRENQLEIGAVRPRINDTRSAEKHSARKGPQHARHTTPRLEQFPSPRPLSEQEKLLVAYASEYPKQAAEVAQEQGRRDKELQAMYPVPGPDSNQER